MHEADKPESSNRKIVFGCLTLAMAVFLFDISLPLGVAGGVPYILVVLLALWSPRPKLPIYMALLASILIICGFYFSPPGGELWKVLLNRALALFAVWTTAVLGGQRNRIQQEREKALLELKILSGFLPICASCKKIRDENGDWNQIETYIRDHSEAEFSHGICPDCARELYPELLTDKKTAAPKGSGG
jgi:hypothetical protein